MPLIGFTCKLEVNDGAADAFQTVSEAVMITLPAEEIGEAEITTLGQQDGSSNPDPVRRFMGTLEDPGVLKCSAQFNKALLVRLRTLKHKTKTYKITTPDEDPGAPTVNLVASGDGFMRKIEEVGFEKDGVVEIKFEVRRAKAWTYT